MFNFLIQIIFGFFLPTGLYFLPSIIALKRNLPNTTKILLINFLLGWTGFGWFVAFVDSCQGKFQWIAKLGSVLVFILILVAISIPGLLRAKMSANEAVARGNIETLAGALEGYALDHDGAYPEDAEALYAYKPDLPTGICGGATYQFAYQCNFSSEHYKIFAVGVPADEGLRNYMIENGKGLVVVEGK